MDINTKLVWLKRFRVAWISRKEWDGYVKKNWWLSFKRHEHWKVVDHWGISEVVAHSYQLSILGLNIAYKILH